MVVSAAFTIATQTLACHGYEDFTDATAGGSDSSVVDTGIPDGGSADSSAEAGESSTSANPCLTENGGCSPRAVCTQTGPGSRSCACSPGYAGDGLTCSVPSCAGGGAGAGSDCGLTGSNDCCGSLPLPAGSFQKDRGTTNFPATLSAFRLDAYEVTVGRFRKFVNAVAPASGTGWQPPVGSGKQSHLNAGKGLLNVGGPAGYESGWDAAWPSLPATMATWNANLASSTPTWTPTASGNENLPITNVSWFEAYAFCTWDGGFLPTQTEWQYAAYGGDEERERPWCTAAPCAIDDTYVVYCGGACSAAEPVGRKTRGNGKWGQSDLLGNAAEWVLDWYWSANPYGCVDCAVTVAPTGEQPSTAGSRVILGFSYANDASQLSGGAWAIPATRSGSIGLRCARTP